MLAVAGVFAAICTAAAMTGTSMPSKKSRRCNRLPSAMGHGMNGGLAAFAMPAAVEAKVPGSDKARLAI